jgi:hypothetical protein
MGPVAIDASWWSLQFTPATVAFAVMRGGFSGEYYLLLCCVLGSVVLSEMSGVHAYELEH